MLRFSSDFDAIDTPSPSPARIARFVYERLLRSGGARRVKKDALIVRRALMIPADAPLRTAPYELLLPLRAMPRCAVDDVARYTVSVSSARALLLAAR